ncbi:MAG: T9SS type A sorting domain-containing protein [Flavipsychrobacter sp.]|nr:T9SS type A sorting domain-containing protein [Flavipsychrobacter sp.]
MKKVALLLSSFALLQTAEAQISITGNGFNYTQDFNYPALDSTGTNLTLSITGWAIKEVGTSMAANNLYRAGNGSANAGDVYSLGTVMTTDRALGSIASGTNQPSYGARFDNNSIDTIQKVVISHLVEQWRAGTKGAGNTDTVWFYYSTVADSVGDTVSANWIEVPALMINSVFISTASDSVMDGNLASNQANMLDSFNVTVNPGAHIIFKWKDKNVIGNDDALAIDDLSITFKGVTGVSVANVQNVEMPLTVLGAATNSLVTVGYSVAEAGKYTLSVYDLTGRTVYTQQVQATLGANRTSFDGNLQSGMYIIKVSNGVQTGITKAMVN